MTKRSFFKSIASIVATVALAPEIAFGRKLEIPVAKAFNPEDYMGEVEFINIPTGKRVEFRADWSHTAPHDADELRKAGYRPHSELQRLRKEAGISE